ncbi:holo-ACP synthase [Helicobacter cappadocius]|uniref:Holo-[acyl-carrier-protein] synthase n=1 Tax=Helicobacter cappadocius TaxID=3063998 RepID=A0AA90SSL2_9HELI|nr:MULTISPECIES: holo-ACP synthase [unclassified Helicobacter]MDO7252981.1 holo-ACP synthase [Helicobacter sp. faydin-H75]MDP2539029.1 holo-ACP synthase [Helicobacter sp. faydin-H76]
MIGIDIVAISRIEKNLKRYGEDFLNKFLNQEEILLVNNSSGYKVSTIAGFWAAKEACSKALGVGICEDLRFFDIKLSKSKKNAPLIILSEKKMKFFNIDAISVSISHDGGFAIAAVMAKFKN